MRAGSDVGADGGVRTADDSDGTASSEQGAGSVEARHFNEASDKISEARSGARDLTGANRGNGEEELSVICCRLSGAAEGGLLTADGSDEHGFSFWCSVVSDLLSVVSGC